MTDFGELRNFLDGGALTCTIAGTPITVQPAASDVLAVLAELNHSELTRENAWIWGARLLGMSYDPATGALTGALADQLFSHGATVPDLDRLLQTVVIFYWLGEPSAKNFWQTGDILKKADSSTPDPATASATASS